MYLLTFQCDNWMFFTFMLLLHPCNKRIYERRLRSHLINTACFTIWSVSGAVKLSHARHLLLTLLSALFCFVRFLQEMS